MHSNVLPGDLPMQLSPFVSPDLLSRSRACLNATCAVRRATTHSSTSVLVWTANIRQDAAMSRAIRPTKPTREAGATLDGVQSTNASLSLGQSFPLSSPLTDKSLAGSPPARPDAVATASASQGLRGPSATASQHFASDALGQTSRALSIGSPNLHQLQSEGENLLQGNTNHLKHGIILQLASIFTYEQILAKVQAYHGDQHISHSALAGRIKDAKSSVARSRGVSRAQIAEELDRNRKLSGAADHGRKLAGARGQVTRTGVSEKLDGFDGVSRKNAFQVGYKNTVHRAAGDQGGKRKKEAGSDATNSAADQEDVTGEQDGGLDMSGVDDPEELHPDPWLLPVDGAHTSSSIFSRIIRPFDPAPYGQPYAGTRLHVAGFREDGRVSWQEWIDQHPYLYQML